MKKLYSIVLMAAALLIGTNMRAVEVADLAGLQGALATGGDITLTADIDAGSTALTVGQGITLNGNGHCVKGTATYVFEVTTTSAVKFENLVIWSAKASKGGQGVLIGGQGTADNNITLRNNQKVTFENVTINATARGMDIWYGDNIEVTINNCTIQNVQGQTVDSKGNPTAAKYDIELTGPNASNSRGINIGYLTNSKITVTNSTLQGFFYVINNVMGYNPNTGIMEGSKIVVANSDIKGRAALNVWGYGAEYTFTDCNIIGINNYGSSQEGFACFVFNESYTCHDNTLTINGGTTVAAVFNETGSANSNANQYLVDDRAFDTDGDGSAASNNTIIINNSSYTCTKELGDDKGGVIASVGATSNVTINGGNYDCPNIVGDTYSESGQTGTITITGGEFTVNTVAPDMTNGDVYSTVDIQGGTFVVPDPGTGGVVDIATLEDPNNPGNKLISSTVETITNQNGTVSVVPAGTTDNTSSALATEIEWNDANDWTVPTDSSNVVIAANQTVTLEGAAGAAYHIDMGDGAKLIVKNGTTLTIGEGGVSLYNGGTAKPQIVIEQGAKVITYGLMYNSVTENLIIKASAAGYGQLLIDPQVQAYGDNHPMATVEFISKSWRKTDGSAMAWQRFGIPSFGALTEIVAKNPTTSADVPTAISVFNKDANEWVPVGIIGSMDLNQMATPFEYYQMLNNTPDMGTVVTMKGQLYGNGSPELAIRGNFWNGFANSYMAPINGSQLLSLIPNTVDKAFYLNKIDGNQASWESVTSLNIIMGLMDDIKPMQPFLIRNTKAAADVTIDYAQAVYNPATSVSNPAPARRDENLTFVKIGVQGAEGFDRILVAEGADFSAEFDNGYDAVKFMNEDINLYVSAAEKMGNFATNDLNNTYVGFKAINGGNYTIEFANVQGEELILIDHETGAQVAMVEGATYEFTADANSTNDYRFEIVEPAKLPTAIENAEAVKSAKGIYTITGQYVGEMSVWNTLPAGIYVVNGEKLVK